MLQSGELLFCCAFLMSQQKKKNFSGNFITAKIVWKSINFDLIEGGFACAFLDVDLKLVNPSRALLVYGKFG
jgi:hypothetical protein